MTQAVLPKSGLFIVFEGVEGVGKSTQVQLLQHWLEQQQIKHVLTREPGGTLLAESIRSLVLEPSREEICPETELLLMMAARMQHWQGVIAPALQRGEWVVCDRFIDSSIAYQGAGRGLSQQLIRDLHHQLQPNMIADLVIVLDMPLEDAAHRVEQRGDGKDRMEQASVDFFRKARECFLNSALQQPQRYAVVNANQPKQSIALQIQQIIQARM